MIDTWRMPFLDENIVTCPVCMGMGKGFSGEPGNPWTPVKAIACPRCNGGGFISTERDDPNDERPEHLKKALARFVR